MKIEVIDSLEELQRHADAWNRLALDAPQRAPMISHAWAASFYENFLSRDESWQCVMAYDGAELVGALPVVVSPHPVFGPYRPRLSTPHNKHSYSVDFISIRGREREVIPFLLNGLREAQPRAYDLCLTRLPETSPTIAALGGQINGAAVLVEPNGAGSFIKIEGEYDQYRRSLSNNFRRNLIKAHNKLARLSDYGVIFLTGPDATEIGMGEFMRIEASGWKARAGTAILQSPKLISYYQSLARRFSELRWLEWHFLRAKGRLIAAQMAVRIGRALSILKIAYDEEYAEYSPGNVLFERTIARAYAAGDTDEIDCITDMQWHQTWAMRKRLYYNLWIYPRRPLPWMVGAVGRRARMGLRRMPGYNPLVRMLRNLVGDDSTR